MSRHKERGVAGGGQAAVMKRKKKGGGGCGGFLEWAFWKCQVET